MSVEIGSKEWHEERRLGIGGSDCAAALGLSKWKSAYQLYLEKTGEAEPQPENWNMARGKAMEPLLRQHFADHFGIEVHLPVAAIVSDQYPWMRYNPDGLAGNVLAEFKTARSAQGWGEPGSDEIPQEYAIQCQHGLIVTKQEIARPSVSIAFAEPIYYEILPDKELQQMIIEGTHEFWQRVQDNNPPEPTTAEDVARRFKTAREGRVIATPEVEIAVIRLKNIKEDINTLESEKEIVEIYIKNFLAENDTLAHNAGAVLATWRAAKGAERLDTKSIKENEPDIWERYLKIGKPTRRFLVK